ncbi:MAG: TrkA family potassium uptake protein [Dehalococcoidia bacterium]|nr:TrkA family potassium uptake protein [Dehalococcoidia bacterium]MDZ4247349.1 TrkA family potassium uptake protein [Dehalococcoidia bacterium]
MYFIIVGGGKVGYYLAKALLSEAQEVLIIEREGGRCDRIVEELGSVCLRGDGCETTTLAEAGTNRCDMFIAVTDGDEDNLVACQVAKRTFQVPRTIALVNNPKNDVLFKKLGVDVTVSSTAIILEHIEQEVPTHQLVHLFSLGKGELELVEIRLPQDSWAIGKRVMELKLPVDCVLNLIIRKGQKPLIPSQNTILERGDQIVAVTRHDLEEELRDELTRNTAEKK